MRMSNFLLFLAIIYLGCNLQSCMPHAYSPKPRGYFRINLPPKSYQPYTGHCPYTFYYPTYSQIVNDSTRNAKPCWVNIVFPQFNGRIHVSYQAIKSQKNFNDLVEDARTFAFKHTIKATSIDETKIAYPDRKVYGVYYTIDGNTASSAQFFLTDSIHHYLRAALYFQEEPRLDSIAPVLSFIKEDIEMMIKTFKWKKLIR